MYRHGVALHQVAEAQRVTPSVAIASTSSASATFNALYASVFACFAAASAACAAR